MTDYSPIHGHHIYKAIAIHDNTKWATQFCQVWKAEEPLYIRGKSTLLYFISITSGKPVMRNIKNLFPFSTEN